MPFLKPLIRDGETKLKKNPARFLKSSSNRLSRRTKDGNRRFLSLFQWTSSRLLLEIFSFFFFSRRTQCSSISQTTRSLLLNAIIFLFYFYLRKRDKMGCGWFWKIKNVKFAIIKAMLDLNFLRFLICN